MFGHVYAAPTCGFYSCSTAGYALKVSSSTVVCATGSCTDALCCTGSPSSYVPTSPIFNVFSVFVLFSANVRWRMPRNNIYDRATFHIIFVHTKKPERGNLKPRGLAEHYATSEFHIRSFVPFFFQHRRAPRWALELLPLPVPPAHLRQLSTR